MSIFLRVWRLMWQYHDQMKQLLRLKPLFATDGMILEKSQKESKVHSIFLFAEQTAEAQEYPSSSSKHSYSEQEPEDQHDKYSTRQKIGLFLGPLLFLLTLLFPTLEGLTNEGKSVAAIALWMATWWITEAVPIPLTSLLPILLFPATGAVSSKAATAPYANDLIYLYLGGFLLAIAIEQWNLHRRIALHVIKMFGKNLDGLVLGFMVATGFLSMWISNTATSMMMLPIGLAVIYQIADLFKEKQININTEQGKFPLGTALMLGIAYSASIGGVATIIGTPPNTVLVAFINETYDKQISFGQWMVFGVPIAVVSLLFTWWYLTKIAFKTQIKSLPGGIEVINNEIRKLGRMSKQEKQVLVIFSLTAFLWIIRTFAIDWFKSIDIHTFDKINDTTIAMFAAILLFVIPVSLKNNQFLLSIDAFKKVPWGILLLFGGGLSLADAMADTGLAEWIALKLQALENVPALVLMLAVTTLVIFLTEMTSNTATATMMMPVMAALAMAMHAHPYGFLITAAVAASFAFMLPVATPPNAIVFGTGYITIPQMAKAGFWLNIFGVLLITLLAYYYIPVVWNFDPNVLPDWAVFQPK
ncbi:SLC13 family permease [Tepidibacillus decaturensis]|uniref:Sodium-dependent dicarboxylate transporter SdcS n=1 Tax=Tepidibacillus decaturensis TaxID=1413211 RepID=A0A135L2L2_9BACI|nr:DASS family sodium-coupled anion symporter [Tepidibacillus decaturensis]KXG43139.1 anion transporter [Tepidibacillus decaturensis]